MERGRARSENGAARGDEPPPPALGEVARDVMDHAAIIVRDRIEIGKLEARRYAEHVRRDVAPRAAFGVAAAVLAAVAVLSGLLALFLGIARALDSVAWAFAIYAALFAVLAVFAYALSTRAPRRAARPQRSRYPTGGSTSFAALETPRKT